MTLMRFPINQNQRGSPAKIKTPLMLQSALTDDQVIDVKDMAKAILWIYEQPQNICIRDLVIAPTYYEA